MRIEGKISRSLLALFVGGLATSASACSGDPAVAPPDDTNASATDAAPATSSTADDVTRAPDASSTITNDAGTPTPVTCGNKPGKTGDITLDLDVGGVARKAYVHVPASYMQKGTMVVLNFHGLMSNAGQQMAWSKMNPASDKHGFIAVHPEGISNSWNAKVCCGGAAQNDVDDIAFVKALVAKLEADWCIDPKRIYATGMSNGGHFSYRLACLMSDVFAAVAPVSGQLLELSCNPARPIPVLHIHGTSDTIVSYEHSGYRSVAESLAVFQQDYGCAGAAKGAPWFDKGDTKCASFNGCAAELAHCRVEGGGHTWPGGIETFVFGKTSTDLDATETIFGFFDKHPMP